MYNANKHENQKIVQRDAGEVRDEVPSKKGPKRPYESRASAIWWLVRLTDPDNLKSVDIFVMSAKKQVERFTMFLLFKKENSLEFSMSSQWKI